MKAHDGLFWCAVTGSGTGLSDVFGKALRAQFALFSRVWRVRANREITDELGLLLAA